VSSGTIAGPEGANFCFVPSGSCLSRGLLVRMRAVLCRAYGTRSCFHFTQRLRAGLMNSAAPRVVLLWFT